MSNDDITQQQDELPVESQKDEGLEAQAQEYLNGWKRALADYDNLKKETARHTVEMREFQTMHFFESLLPLVDLYETALQHVPESERKTPWFEGLRQILVELQRFIKDNDVTKVEVESSFDPAHHEAVETQSDASRADGEILSVVSPGYAYKNRLLRPAKVVVNKLSN